MRITRVVSADVLFFLFFIFIFFFRRVTFEEYLLGGEQHVA